MQPSPARTAAPAADPARRRTPARVAALVAAAVLMLQAAWIVTVPPFAGSDEIDHAFRAAGVASGQLRAGEPVPDGRGLQVRVPAALADAARDRCESLPYNGRDNCAPVRDLGDGTVLIGSSAGAYHPAGYVFPALASLTAEGTASLYAMRVGAALGCTALVALGVWALASWSRTRWPIAGLLVGLTPVTAYSLSLPAPNGLEIAAGLSAWCCLLGVGERDDPRLDRRLLLAAVPGLAVLLTVRTLGPLFALLIVLAVVALRPARLLAITRREWRTVAVVALVLALVSAQSLWWIASADLTSPEPWEAVPYSLRAFLPVWLFETVAAFPMRGDVAHPVVYLLGLAAYAGLWLAAARQGGRVALVGVVVLVSSTIVLPVTLTLATVDVAGVIWQGRYVLPLLLGVSLLAGLALDRGGRPVPRPVGLALVGGATLASTVSLLVLLTDVAAALPTIALVIALVLGAGVAWARAVREPAR